MIGEETARKISEESDRQVVERLGSVPETWYTGGSNHNDFRLVATVENGRIMVTDGHAIEEYLGDDSDQDIQEFVSDWLDATMPKHLPRT